MTPAPAAGHSCSVTSTMIAVEGGSVSADDSGKDHLAPLREADLVLRTITGTLARAAL